MAQYLIECPQCEARFELLKYEPDRRVRCRRCGGVMIVPTAPGEEAPSGPPEAKPLDARTREKLVRVFSIRKLALVALLLCLALAGAFALVVHRGRAGRPPVAEAETAPRSVSLKQALEMNRLLALPLRAGHTWEYLLSSGRMERRRVATASEGAGGGPEFDVGVSGSLEAGTESYRVLPDGVYRIAEARDGARRTWDPPLPVVPHPIYSDSEWEYEGVLRTEGGAESRVRLSFRVTRVEQVKTRAGEYAGFRVDVTGTRGSDAVDEKRWYAKGVGLVRRESRRAGSVETAELALFSPAP